MLEPRRIEQDKPIRGKLRLLYIRGFKGWYVKGMSVHVKRDSSISPKFIGWSK